MEGGAQSIQASNGSGGPGPQRPEDLQRAAREHPWYHTFELAPGVVTPGWFDLRRIVERIPFPESLEGWRCLDVGTFDGFWAFEMERRGGAVTAIDVLDPRQWDWPAGSEEATMAAINERKRGGAGFELVAALRESTVERRELSVYDAEPDDLGRFDLVYIGSLLLHLRDPVLALTRLRELCTGRLILCDAVDPLRTAFSPRQPLAILDGEGRPWWWRPNVAALERMVEAAGFRRMERTRRLRMPPGAGMPRPRITLAAARARAAREQILHSRFGDPHAVIVAEPLPDA